jgi:hypothetical protein
MINKIQSLEDVKAFSKLLIAEGVSFHPDDDFNDYVNFKENKSFYSKTEAEARNNLMNDCFDVCNREDIDVYDLMLESSLSELNFSTDCFIND